MMFRVIGVVGDVPGDRIEDGPTPTVYFPILRDGDGLPRDVFPVPFIPRGVHYVVRAGIQPSAQTIRALVRDVDPRIPAVRVQPLTEIVDAATARVRLTLLLLSVAAGAALLLGVVGVYSVVSYAAAGRLREFGVRLALGATPRGVASIVLHDGAIVGVVGVTGGLAVAFAGTRFLESLLFEVSATSVGEFGAAVVLIAFVTLVATFIPARRASRTDPAVVLRGE
jgi:ABC-type lipoprotein release transport system permease subunit